MNINHACQILGIDESQWNHNEIDQTQLRKIYYKRALVCHPDKLRKNGILACLSEFLNVQIKTNIINKQTSVPTSITVTDDLFNY